MYPQYWTLSIGGIFMKYSYEYKKQCVELYRQGKWPETPVGEKQKNFHKTIRKWARMEEAVEDNRLLCYTGHVETVCLLSKKCPV